MAGNVTTGDLSDALPRTLIKTLEANLASCENILVRLKGTFKEALVCTDQRVIILKSGFMTGQIFGSDMFQLPYSGIASAQVKFHLLTGYFEVSAGGMQNTPKTYWGNSPSRSAKAPNAIAITGRHQATRFRQACGVIMERATNRGTAPATPSTDVAGAIDRLWSLKSHGALTQAEFDAAKAKLLG